MVGVGVGMVGRRDEKKRGGGPGGMFKTFFYFLDSIHR